MEMPKRFRITVSRVRFHWIKSSLTMTTVSLHLFPPLMLQLHARYYIVSMISKSGILFRVLKFFSIEITTKARERLYIQFLVDDIYRVFAYSSNLGYFPFPPFFFNQKFLDDRREYAIIRGKKSKDNSTIVIIVDY